MHSTIMYHRVGICRIFHDPVPVNATLVASSRKRRGPKQLHRHTRLVFMKKNEPQAGEQTLATAALGLIPTEPVTPLAGSPR